MNTSEFAAEIKKWDIEKLERYIGWMTESDVAEFRQLLRDERDSRRGGLTPDEEYDLECGNAWS